MKILLSSIVSLFCFHLFADEPSLVPVPAESAFLIEGFDSNDRTQIVINGILPDTCYQAGPYDAYVNPRDFKISIYQKAYLHKGLCMDVITPYRQTIDLNLLPQGNYEVVDGVSLKALGRLNIAQAKSGINGSDDFHYAPVEDATLGWNNQAAELRLEGTFTNRCMQFKEVRYHYQAEDQILVVQPIVEKIDGEGGCEDGRFKFVERVTIPELGAGTYFFHIRAMNGLAVNKVLTLDPK